MNLNVKVKGDPYGSKEEWYIGVKQPGPLMMDCFREVNVFHGSDMMPLQIRAAQAHGTFVETLNEEIQERNMSAGKRTRMLSHEQVFQEVQFYNDRVAAEKALKGKAEGKNEAHQDAGDDADESGSEDAPRAGRLPGHFVIPSKKKPKTEKGEKKSGSSSAVPCAPSPQNRERSRSRSAHRRVAPCKKKSRVAISAPKGPKVQVVERADAKDLNLSVRPESDSKTEVMVVALRASSDPPRAYLQRKEKDNDYFDFWKAMFGTADRLSINKASEYFYVFCL